jgi:hypothetical protein
VSQVLVDGRKRAGVALTATEGVAFLTQIAAGMGHVAALKVVHRDLALRNCLLGVNNVVKVADFGLGRAMAAAGGGGGGGGEALYMQQDTNAELPIKWMATESLLYGKFTSESDVWSLGVTGWEIFAEGLAPYHGRGITNTTLLAGLEAGIRLRRPPLCPAQVWTALVPTWDEQPASRPTFAMLVEQLTPELERLVARAPIRRDLGRVVRSAMALATDRLERGEGDAAAASSGGDAFYSRRYTSYMQTDLDAGYGEPAEASDGNYASYAASPGSTLAAMCNPRYGAPVDDGDDIDYVQVSTPYSTPFAAADPPPPPSFGNFGALGTSGPCSVSTGSIAAANPSGAAGSGSKMVALGSKMVAAGPDHVAAGPDHVAAGPDHVVAGLDHVAVGLGYVAVGPDHVAVQELDRSAAVAVLLSSGRSGACVVRKSSSATSGMVLSVFQRGEPKHFRIGADPPVGSGALYIDETNAAAQRYGSLAELVAGAGHRPPLKDVLVPLMPAAAAAAASAELPEPVGDGVDGFDDVGVAGQSAEVAAPPSSSLEAGYVFGRKPSVYLGFGEEGADADLTVANVNNTALSEEANA